MIPRTPSSTLFPYTTLFRSLRPGARRQRRARPAQVALRAGGGGSGEPLVRDRKSTRLNSSHPSISYAVFFLKKKKKCMAVELMATANGLLIVRDRAVEGDGV